MKKCVVDSANAVTKFRCKRNEGICQAMLTLWCEFNEAVLYQVWGEPGNDRLFLYSPAKPVRCINCPLR